MTNKELGPEEWQEMLEQDRLDAEADPDNAMNSPLGLNEETKRNLIFMVVTIGIILAIGLIGGWYYLV